MVVLNSSEQGVNMEGREKIVLVAQEITFVKTLASNDLRLRNRAIKKLRKWLQNRTQPNQESPFTRDDMLRIWKGLFYCMWMSDKPLIQEELADNISSLVHCLNQHSVALNFIEAFFLTMREEWFNIDTFRLNKFQMLVRRMLRQGLALVARKKWVFTSRLADILWNAVLKDQSPRPPPLGLGLHVCEIFLEELAKVSGSTGISQKALTTLLSAFARCLANKAGDARLRTTVCTQVFGHLIKQSDAGLDHQEKVDAWRRMGCPSIPLDQIERVEVEDEESVKNEERMEDEEIIEREEKEEKEEVLDPRAGQLDVELPQIPFNATAVASMLHKLMSDPDTNAKAKRRLKFVAQKFTDLDKGKYPLTFQVPISEEEELWNPEADINEAAEELLRFEEQLEKEEVEQGVATYRIAARVKAQQLNTPKVRKRKARRKPAWHVTAVAEDTNGSSSDVSRSPGTQGQWEISPVRESENKEKKAKQSDWEEPLKEGEYEYFVAPRKSKSPQSGVKKRRSSKITKVEEEPVIFQVSPASLKNLKQQTTLNTVINANLSKLVKKLPNPGNGAQSSPHTPVVNKRTSLDNDMCTPLSKKCRVSLTGSAKRVDIQLKHNKFQDLHQHVEQIKNSPGIPHDPNKRPTKSLLKTPTSSPLMTRKRGSILFS